MDASVGTATGIFRIITDQAQNALQGLSGRMKDMQGMSFDRLAGSIQTVGVAVTATGALMTAGLVSSVNAASNFQAAMTAVQAVMSPADWQTYGDAISDTAVRLGQDYPLSATEAAQAIEELSKIGISATDIVGGAADGVAMLSIATGTDLVTSAGIAATAMNQFGLEGKDMANVADIITNAANVSSLSAVDLGSALSYVGNTANNLGYDLDDTATSIAILSDRGIDASKAGTGLRRMFMSLISPTAEASGAMEQLGLASGQTFSVYDENGNMKAMPELINNVRQATENMTSVERANYLNKIFGLQGGEAMLALIANEEEALNGTGTAWADYNDNVTRAGSAQEAADIRMQGVAGAMELLRGTIESLQISLGQVFLPIIEKIIRGLAAFVNVIASLPGPILGVIAVIGGIAGVVLTAGGALMVAAPLILNFAKAWRDIAKAGPEAAKEVRKAVSAISEQLTQMNGPLGKASTAFKNFWASARSGDFNIKNLGSSLMGLARAHPVIAGLTIGAAALGLAYKTNFLGIRDGIDKVVDGAKGLWGAFTEGFGKTGEAAQVAEDQIADVAEATKVVDGVTVYTAFKTNADGTREEIGDITESILNADGKTAEVKIEGDDGPYWATIDLATGEITNARIEVEADDRGTIQKLQDGLAGLQAKAEAMGIGGITGPIVGALQTILSAVAAVAPHIQFLTDRFQVFRDNGINPISAALFAFSDLLGNFNFGPLQGGVDQIIAGLNMFGAGIQNILGAVRMFATAISQIWQGNFTEGFATARAALEQFGKGFSQLYDGAAKVLNGIAVLFDRAADRFPVFGDSLRAISSVFGNLSDAVRAMGDVVKAVFAGDWGGAADAAKRVFTGVLQTIRSAVTAIGSILSDLGGLLQRGVAKAVDALAKRFPALANTIRRVGDVIGNVLGVFTKLGEALKDLMKGDFSGAFSNLTSAFGDAVQAIFSSALVLPTLIWDIITGTDWGAVWNGITAAWDAVVDFFANIDYAGIWAGIKESIAGVWNSLVEEATEAWENVRAFFEGVDWGAIWEGIKTAASAVWDALGETFQAGVERVLSFFQSTPWGDIFNGIGEAAQNIAGKLGDVAGAIWNWLTGQISGMDWAGIGSTLVSGFTSAWTAVSGWIDGIDLSRMAEMIGTAADAVLTAAQNLSDKVLEGLQAGWNAVSGWIDGIDMGRIGTMIGNAAGAISSAASTLIDGIVTALTTAWTKVSGWIDTIDLGRIGTMIGKAAGALNSAATSLINGIRTALTTAWTTISSWIDSIDLSRIGTKISEAGEDLYAKAEALIGKVKEGFDAAWAKIVEWGTNIKDTVIGWFTFDIPTPKLPFGWGGGGGDDQPEAPAPVQNPEGSNVPAPSQGTFDGTAWANAINAALVTAVNALDASVLGGAIENWVWRAVQSIGANLADDGVAFAVALDTAFTAGIGTSTGASLAEAIMAWIGRAQTAVAAFLMPLGVSFGVLLDTAYTTGIGASSGASLSGAIISWVGRANTIVAAQIMTLGTAFGVLLDTAFTAGIGALSGASLGAAIGAWVGRGITAADALITPAVTTMMTNFNTKVTTALITTGTAWNTHRSTVASIVAGLQSAVTTTINAMATQMETTLRSALTRMQTNTSTTFTTIANTISNQMGAARSTVSGRMGEIQSSVSTGFSNVQSTVQSRLANAVSSLNSAMSQMVSGARTGASNVNSEISSKLSQIAGIVQGYGGAMYSAGSSIGAQMSAGIADGMESAMGRVINAANRIVAEAERAARAAAQVRSPSRLFAVIGAYLTEGLATGMENIAAMSMVTQAGEGIISRAQDSVAGSLALPSLVGQTAAFSSGFGGALAAGSGAAGNITVNILTLPTEEWLRLNSETARNSTFVKSWMQPEAIVQYLGGSGR